MIELLIAAVMIFSGFLMYSLGFVNGYNRCNRVWIETAEAIEKRIKEEEKINEK